jgi:uncharacterized membrane protein (DUF4010 family)
LVVPLSNLLVYTLGPITLTQTPWVTVAAVLVIATREQMHGFVRLIPRDEVLTAGKFLILVGIILPLTPDTRFISIAPVTPFSDLARFGRDLWPLVFDLRRPAVPPGQGERASSGAARRRLLVYCDNCRFCQAPKGTRTRHPELSAAIIAATAVMYPRLLAVIAF